MLFRSKPEWVSIVQRIGPNVPLTEPKVPAIVKAGGVEIVTVSAKLNAEQAEAATVAAHGGAFLGLVVATMKTDGKLYLL